MKKTKTNPIAKGFMLLLLCAKLSSNEAGAQSSPYDCGGAFPPPMPTYGTSTVSFPCAPSTAPTSSFTTFYQKKENYIPDNTKTEALYVEKVIKMHITVLQEVVGPKRNYEPSVTDIDTIKKMVERANYYLANNTAPSDPITIDGRDPHVHDTRFSIQLVGPNNGITFKDDVDLQFEYFEGGGDPMASYPSLLYDYDNVLNVYIVYADKNSIPGGLALISPLGASPGVYSHLLNGFNSQTPYIILKNFYKSNINIESAANYLLHEIGHTMDIHHTYLLDWGTVAAIPEEGDETHFDYLRDVFNEGTNKIFYRPVNSGSYPPAPYSFYDPSNPATANDTLTNNFMGGNSKGHYYSPMQIGRMHRNAHFLGCRRYIYNKWPEDSLHSNVGQGQIHPLLVSNNQTWDFDIKMYSDIIVKSGATLTITCRVMMPYLSNIIVEPGAKLIVDGGIITTDRKTNNYFWYGISVLGDASKPQDLAGAQGIVEIKNNATIENAMHGVNAGDEVHRDGSKAGGIIKVSDANFINNKNAISFWKFDNKAVWPVGLHRPNRSFIRSSLFELNDQYQYDNADHPWLKMQGQVHVWAVDGVQIQGCNMENKMTIAKRTRIGSGGGVGIEAFEGNFLLDKYAHSSPSGSYVLPSKINGFVHGVRADGVVSVPFIVTNTSFTQNRYGLLTNGIVGQEISRSTFLIKDPAEPGLHAVGIYAYGTNAFNIHSDSFYQDAVGTFNKGIGIRIEESSPNNNLINNNTFNRIATGVISKGMHTNGYDPSNITNNTGLHFRCNTFIANYTDISVMGSDSTKDGIRSIQGLPDNPAGNTFSAFLSSGLGIHFRMQQIGSGPWAPNLVMPVPAYYYSTTAGAGHQPTKYTTGRVTPIARPITPICTLSGGPSDGTSLSKVGGASSTISYTALSMALNDSSENRHSLIVAAYQGMHSAYADAELSLYHIRAGQISQGISLYSSIANTYSLNSKEQQEFAIGASLIRLVAHHYQNGITMDSLSTADADTLHYITANAVTWPRAKACSWLRYALGEECAIAAIPDEPIDSNQNWRESPNSLSAADDNKLSVVPNPSADYFNFQYQLTQAAQLAIMDINGRIVSQTTLDPLKNNVRIDAHQWPSGVYLYKLLQGEQTLYYGKLLKH